MANSQGPISNHYANRKIFLTGATGFLGSVLLWKLISSTACQRITVMVRGGENRFWKRMGSLLPPAFVSMLYRSGRVVVVQGDLKKPNLGLSDAAVTALSEASIVIHAASSINLNYPLAKIAPTVLYATMSLANLAIATGCFDRFVYVSTAYANAHLHHEHDLVETMIQEDTYPIENSTTEKELEELEEKGSTRAFEAANFPFAYSYAKHLTERALASLFERNGRRDRLLIIRPSVLGPALNEPYPYYEVPRSAPATGFLTALVLSPSVHMTLASPFDDPDSQSTIDEVPVDIVANQIIVQVALQSQGYVHCVAGSAGRRTFGDLWEKAMRLRALPWKPQVYWKCVDWKSNDLHPIARFFTVFGTSFNFDQSKSTAVWNNRMSEEDRECFPLFLRSCRDLEDLSQRRHAVHSQLSWFFGRHGIPQLLASAFIKKNP